VKKITQTFSYLQVAICIVIECTKNKVIWDTGIF